MTPEEAFKEKIRYWRETGGLQISPRATPTRSSLRPNLPRANPNSNAWERGIARDHRGMPILNEKCQVMGVKELAGKRSWVEEQRQRRAAKVAAQNRKE